MFNHCGLRTKTGNLSIYSKWKGGTIYLWKRLIGQIQTAEALYWHWNKDFWGFCHPLFKKIVPFSTIGRENNYWPVILLIKTQVWSVSGSLLLRNIVVLSRSEFVDRVGTVWTVTALTRCHCHLFAKLTPLHTLENTHKDISLPIQLPSYLWDL